MSGYSCDNGGGVSYTVNQPYTLQGSTADGRPYYRGTEDTSIYLYFSSSCAPSKVKSKR